MEASQLWKSRDSLTSRGGGESGHPAAKHNERNSDIIDLRSTHDDHVDSAISFGLILRTKIGLGDVEEKLASYSEQDSC